MQTFFVTYSTGEYDSHCEHVYTIDAASKEELLAEIDRACDRFCDKMHDWKNNRRLLDEKFRPKNYKAAGEIQWKTYHQELNKFFEKFDFQRSLVVFGKSIAPFDDLTSSSCKEEAIQSSDLSVMAVEEYIEHCRAPDEI